MPASARQIEANRRNAAGPHRMTEAGKQTVRANAIRHGLTSRVHVILDGEDQQFFQQLRDSLMADYAPANTRETLLVHQVAEHYWRLIRVRNMETGSFSGSLQTFLEEHHIPDQSHPDLTNAAKLALTYTMHDRLFSKISRYETTIERSYYRALRELEKIQSSRIRSVSQPHKAAAESLGQKLIIASATMSPGGIERLLDALTAPPEPLARFA